jgi:hypothetical protein
LTSKAGKTPPSRPFIGDLVIMPVLDTPRATRSLSEDDFKKLGMNANQVYELGRANLEKTLPPLMKEAQVAKHGQIGQGRRLLCWRGHAAGHRCAARPGQGPDEEGAESAVGAAVALDEDRVGASALNTQSRRSI